MSAAPHPDAAAAASATAWASHGFTGTADGLLAARTLVHAALANWRARPAAPAFADPAHGWVDGAAMERSTTRVAAAFASAGLRRGDRILMSCAPSVDLVVCHVAALRLGLVVVPVNTAFTANEVGNIARESRARLAVLDDASRAGDLPVHDPAGSVLAAGDPGDADVTAPDDLALDDCAPDDPAMLIFTSGTTGTPKGALLSHANMCSSVAALAVAWRWTSADRLVLSLPLFHMHGLGVGVHGTLLTGASAVIVPRFTPDAVLDASRDERGTMLFGVPTMWVRLLDSPRVGELAGLRLCVSGSAALAPDVWNGLAERGGQRIVERYGMSETVMLASNPYDGDRRPGSVGLALPGVGLRLGGAGADGVGEIEVCGPNVFTGYADRPDANADAFTADGWFRTGDLGRFDDDGYVHIVGRSKDLIITGGYNVYPRDVEDVLRAHPGVADAAVVGEPSAEWGETVTACVVRAPGAEGDDVALGEALLAHAASHLAGYQKPRRVVLVEELPRNALGKVVKAELLARLRG